MRVFWQLTALVSTLAAQSSLARSADLPKEIHYSQHIRPLLADRCLACHGADPEQRQGGLRLDQRASAIAAAESGHAAIVSGNSEASELIRRIESHDENDQMPPPAAKKTLTADQKELLKRWIAEGAVYEEHWAFQAPVRPPVPIIQSEWPKNEIDSFILARLQKNGMSPSAPADRMQLLRRLSLDLTGLPPTLEEQAAFQSDSDNESLNRLISRLLDSPHYGERWGRIWLDGARYADSDGYEKDKPRFVWAYRDWVVKAFNQDLPYDQFVIDQLAGDLLPSPTQDQQIATGFLRNSMINEEGGIDPEQFRMEAMFDRIDAIGKSMLGLTVQCCQCHDHKYDPISQREYFQLFAFFNDTLESSTGALTADQQRQQAELQMQIALLEDKVKATHPDWEARLNAWEAAHPAPTTAWQVVAPKQEVSGGEKHRVLDDGSVLAQGYAPTKSTANFEVTTSLTQIGAVQLELLNHPELPLNGPGRAVDGTCVLTEFQLEAAPADGSGKFAKVQFSSATADVAPPVTPLAAMFEDKSGRQRTTGPIELAFDGRRETGWSINIGPSRSNVPRTAVFQLTEPIQFPSGARLRFSLVQEHGGWNSDDNQTNNIGRFRLSVTDQLQAQVDTIPVPIRQIFQAPADQRTPGQQAQLFSEWRQSVPEIKELNAQIETLYRQLPQPVAQPTLARRTEHRQTFILAKGNFLQPTDPVEPQVPSMLHPLNVEHPTRLDLARWMVDRKSPTAARSIVNRVWQTYFGTGLVSTSDDFGLQGEPPTHQELLDWLAVDFMEHGWSLKRLHRQILSSAAYQQSSVCTPESLERDPANRLIGRGARFRMEGEGVRDLSLAISGLLNSRMGGPPVCPPCPDFLFQPPASYGPKSWPLAQGAEQYRRALYTFRFRSVPYPALQIFDTPVGDVSCVRRVKSNTPLQALATLNEPVFLECARSFAKTLLAEAAEGDQARLNLACRRCLARLPDEQESQTLLDYLNRQRTRFANGELNASAIALMQNESISGEAASPELQEQAAWTSLCRVLLNLDETITRE